MVADTTRKLDVDGRLKSGQTPGDKPRAEAKRQINDFGSGSCGGGGRPLSHVELLLNCGTASQPLATQRRGAARALSSRSVCLAACLA